MWLIVTNRNTVVISPNVELLRRIGEKLGIKLGPFRIEEVKWFEIYNAA